MPSKPNSTGTPHSLMTLLAHLPAPLHIPPPSPQAIKEFSSDAMRWALADAGDGMDDANFETSTANAAILRLTKELTWIEEVLGPAAGEAGGGGGTWGGRGQEVGRVGG